MNRFVVPQNLWNILYVRQQIFLVGLSLVFGNQTVRKRNLLPTKEWQNEIH